MNQFILFSHLVRATKQGYLSVSSNFDDYCMAIYAIPYWDGIMVLD